MKRRSPASRVVPASRSARLAGLRCFVLFTALLVLVPLSRAQQIPATHAKTLDGGAVSFPDAASGKPLLIVVGFSHASSEPCKAWNKRLSPVYSSDNRILYYEAAELQSVPSLILKVVIRGMKKDIPANEQSRFVILQTNEDQWKSAAQFSAPNDAYVLLSDPAGHIVWHTHGAVTDEQLAGLRTAIKTQLGN